MSEAVDYHKLDNPHPDTHPHVEEGEGPWLMSFADMVTLLMCFFVLFFATNKGTITLEDPGKLFKRLEELERIIGSKTAVDDAVSAGTISARSPIGANRSAEAYRSDLQSVSRDLNLVFSIGVPQPGEIDITFLNTYFFKPGNAELTKRAEVMISAVARKLRLADPDAVIEVEGHTDADPISGRLFPSNWELSGARAASVVRLLARYGIKPERMRATGRAHFNPIAPEKDARGNAIPENKSINRRIVIRIKQQAPPAAAKDDKGAGP